MEKPRWSNKEKERVKEVAEKIKTYSELLNELKKIYPQRSHFSLQKAIKRYGGWKKGGLKKAEPITPNQEVLKMEEKPENDLNSEGLTEDQEKLLKLIKDPIRLDELCEKLDISSNDVYRIVDSIRTKGYEATIKRKEGPKANEVFYEVSLTQEAITGSPTILDGIARKEIKILVITDTGFGLIGHQPELVATALKMAKKQGVNFAIHAGNIVGGKATASTKRDFLGADFDKQVSFANKIPPLPFKLYFLNGPRDLTHKKKGQNVARALSTEREDFRYVEDLETNFFIKKFKIKVMHVKDDVTYTKSYTLQGLEENLEESIKYVYRKERKPNLLLVGGTNTYIHIPSKKKGGVELIGLPSLHAMTSSQKTRKKRGGSPELGYVIVTLKLDKDGNPIEVDHECYLLTAYQRSEAIYEEPNGNGNGTALTEEQKQIINRLKERPYRYGELSREIHRSKANIQKAIEELQKTGYNIVYDEAAGRVSLVYDWTSRKFEPVPVEGMFQEIVKTEDVSDTHTGNKKARDEVVRDKVGKIAEAEKVDLITHSGDATDGPTGAYPGHEFELAYQGADAQKNRFLEIWPKTRIPTIIIAGSSHEWGYWTKSGHNIVKQLAKEATKDGKPIEYIGGEDGLEGTKTINGVIVKLVHPKGGIPYGKSYRLQRFIESMVAEIEEASEGVRVLKVGHLHIAMLMVYKGVVASLVPCLEEQTWYLKGKGLQPWIGLWVVEVTLDKYKNVTKVHPKYISFESGNGSE